VSRPRAIFFGTPDFAVPCLSALLEVAEVVTVVTQPDRPAGRGMRLRPPPVKELAEEKGVPVLQPRKVKTAAFAASLRELGADVALVVAYGRILPRAVLDAPRLGCVNVHASLLPRLRGAAPINWAIARGEVETGVCLMQMDEGMDTGPVLCCERTPIGPEETAGDLSARLAALGGELVRGELPRFLSGELTPRPQDEARATLAPMLDKAQGRIDWTLPAQAVHDHVRGMSPWPGAWSCVQGARVKVHRTHLVESGGGGLVPGVLLRADRHGIEVACGEGAVAIDELQLEGRRRVTAGQFRSGQGWPEGTRFDT